MDDKKRVQHSQSSYENNDEINWIIYGILSSLCMVIYQLFLIEFCNIPSTISSRMLMSMVIGLVTIVVEIVIGIFKTKRLRSLPSQEILLEDDNDEHPSLKRKITLWKGDTLHCNNDNQDSFDHEEYKDHFVDNKQINEDLREPLLDDNYENTSSSIHKLPIINRMAILKDSSFSRDSHSYNIMDKYESLHLSGDGTKYLRESNAQRSRANRTIDLISKFKDNVEHEIEETDENTEGNFKRFVKSGNLTFGVLLYSFSNYLFLYCFEIRRFNAKYQNKYKTHDTNLLFIYGQVLTIVIFPLFFIILWKLKKCDKPILIKLVTLFIPFLIVISLVITSGRVQYESIYLFTYLKEGLAAVLYSVSLVIVKFSQKSLQNTFRAMIYSDMMVSLSFYILRVTNMFVWIYSDDELYPNIKWYNSITNPAMIVPTVTYIAGIYLVCVMMAQLIKIPQSQRKNSNKIRITTVLCMKAFECEILTFISLFISIDYLNIVDVFGIFVFIIAILIMSCDDTSLVFIKELCRNNEESIESDATDDNFSERQKYTFENLTEFYVVETDDSIHVKHREAVSKHYKEASLQYFCLKFYGIDLTNKINQSDEREYIRQKLNEFYE